ncbi:hypothetical protein L7F22_013634 [Adiantum nelumboides]|nr:hypothetical protein [Adiantum nelumboides]
MLLQAKVFSQRQGKWNATIQSLEFFRSLRRHYNNAYLDGEKQDAINIFLGHFRPEVGKLELWQLDSDIHLQVRRAGDDPLSEFRMVKRSLSAGNMFEQNGNSGILRDSLSMKPSILSKPTPLLIALARRGITISEAEMRKGFEEGEDSVVNDSRQEGGSAFNMHSVYGSLNKAPDSRGLGDCADVDWLSSCGNSCEEDAQERHSVSVTDVDTSWPSSGFLPSTLEESETYEDSEYFQDLTNMLLANGNVWSERDARQQSSEELEACHTLQEMDVGSGIIRIRAGAASRGVFSQSFVDWIHEGQTLCY